MANKTRRFFNTTRSALLASDVRVADNFISRFVGLLMSAPLQTGQGLLIVPCNCIHMIGMKFAIDVVFFDKGWNTVGLLEDFRPGKISQFYKEAHCCIELPAGAIASTGTQLGDVFEVG